MPETATAPARDLAECQEREEEVSRLAEQARKLAIAIAQFMIDQNKGENTPAEVFADPKGAVLPRMIAVAHERMCGVMDALADAVGQAQTATFRASGVQPIDPDRDRQLDQIHRATHTSWVQGTGW